MSPVVASTDTIPPIFALANKGGFQLTATAAIRHVQRAQRVASANAEVERQLGGRSVDDVRHASVARPPGYTPPPAPDAARPAAQTNDEMWREIAAKRKHASAIVGCFR